MNKPSKPYVKPAFTIYPAESLMYNRITAALETEAKENRLIAKHPIENKRR